jgi:nitrate reductase delta subunit
MRLFQIIARLLDYPDEELMGSLHELAALVEEDRDLTDSERKDLQSVIAWPGMHTCLGFQELYVQTFDMTPEHDLHLTHHLFGDDQGRGPALIDLAEHYKASGFEVKPGELPDYLPLMLEYVATLDEMQSRVFLGDAGKVLRALAANLEKAGSPYAKLVRILENRGHLVQAA